MAYERPGESPLDYQQCRYGHSRLLFRGPKRETKHKFLAFVGGTETYGKYIPEPFSELIEEKLQMPCVNLGAVNGGIDAFVNDDTVLSLCCRADVTVIQVMGAHNMSNRFYSVHSRRNDRFLKASTLMRTIFREVDFTEYSFTRHLLTSLKTMSPDKFDALEQELKTAWSARMEMFLSKVSGRVVLLWVSDRAPGHPEPESGLGRDPLFIDAEMIAALNDKVHNYVEVVVPPEVIAQGTDGMLFPQLEAAAAQEIYGPAVHDMIAAKLLPVLD
ncbi:MAG: DUF6473 family protein [Pseudomonadota bacterium]